MAAEQLGGALRKLVAADAPSDALLARRLPHLLDMFTQFPAHFLSGSMSRETVLEELSDLCLYLSASPDMKAQIERRHLQHALVSAPSLAPVLCLFDQPSARVGAFDRLAKCFLSSGLARGLPSQILPVLDRCMAARKPVIDAALALHSDGDAIIQALVAEAEARGEETDAPHGGGGGGPTAGDSGAWLKEAAGLGGSARICRAITLHNSFACPEC